MSDQIDNIKSKIKRRNIKSVLSALTVETNNPTYTASNAITETNNNFKLGGALTETTTITGASIYQLILGTSANPIYRYVVAAGNRVDISMTSSGVTSQLYFPSGASEWFVGKFGSSGQTAIRGTEGLLTLQSKNFSTNKQINLLFDNTTGTAQFFNDINNTGLQYYADYSAGFTDRSLVDKGYVTAAISDIRLKENITDLPETLKKVNLLRPVEFDFIHNKEHHKGFIAQEVHKIFPELVIDDDGTLKIKRDEWTPILMKAIQELTQEIKNLKQEINNLKSNGV